MTAFKLFKRGLFILTLLFLLTSIIIISIPKISNSAHKKGSSPEQDTVTQTTEKGSNKVIVYYFHSNFRCYSCKLIEQYTREAIEKYFIEKMKSGILEFKPVNIDEKENKHFIKDYQLYTKSVVVSLIKGGKEQSFKNLEKVWQYLKNRDKFLNYIKEETEKIFKESE
ncbi:MAG: nitrophenyl compound nitroreductase subunit ArsF family protein [bacterium]